MEEHPPFSRQIHTSFDSYPGRTGSQNILSMRHRRQPSPSTLAPMHCASTRTASRWPVLRHSSGIVFRTAWTFFYRYPKLIRTQHIHLHQRQCPPHDSSRSTSALAEMSSQASPGSILGDHLRLHRRSNRRRRILVQSGKVVSVSRLKSLEAIHSTQTLSGRLRRRASLS